MATVLVSAEMVVKLANGTTQNGSIRVKNWSFDVKPTAQDADIIAVGSALANLQKKTALSIYKVQNFELS